MRILSTILSCTLFCAAALAQPASSAASSTTTVAPANTAESKDMTEAEIKKIDKQAKKITLKHGPIKNLDMPGMTMVFQVRNVALLEKLAVGDKIMFTAEQLQGAFVMTHAEKGDPK